MPAQVAVAATGRRRCRPALQKETARGASSG